MSPSESEGTTMIVEGRERMRRIRRKIGLMGFLTALVIALFLRSRIDENTDNLADWVEKLPEFELIFLCGVVGFLNWWFIGRWLGGPRIWPTLIWGLMSAPLGLVLAVAFATLYGIPRLWIATGDFDAAIAAAIYGIPIAYFLLLVTFSELGAVVFIIVPAGFLLALAGRSVHRRSPDPSADID